MDGRLLWRVPYFWEDDFEMERRTPGWHLAPLLAVASGLKVLDFHPIHIYLNSADMRQYGELKKSVARLAEARQTEVDKFINPGSGAGTLFMEVVDHLAASGRSCRIRDLIPAELLKL